MRKESGYCTCHIGIADLSHAFKNISETDTVQKTWDESLDKGKYRIDTESTTPIALEPPTPMHWRKLVRPKIAPATAPPYGSEDDCTDGYRDHVKGNGQWPDVQISQWCVGHQQKDRCHQAQ